MPFDMPAGAGGSTSGKLVRQSDKVSDLLHLHQYPVGKRAGARSGNLPSQQLDRAVEDSVIVRLNDAFFVVIDEPHHAFLLDCLPDLGMRLQRHL